MSSIEQKEASRLAAEIILKKYDLDRDGYLDSIELS